MAETITLRAYLNELNDMLERGAAAEVVSHCRYILQRFPQNVDTYRLLAQALLQRGHNEGVSAFFDEATEVFQRVLSVVPNDYVAHYGLSTIREQDGELDRAIWHMERAYEQLPGNQVLQDALRKLYGKRDGEDNVPTKIQLTRGALARQYVTGQLYDQALIELRNTLQQDPSRVDLEVMLSETLWESQHPIEAGEAAVRILKKLPNCLAANRILARLWLENERPADAQRFLDRLEALDPYVAADVLQPDTEIYDTITLDRLDYNAQAQATLSQETPDWVQELGGIETGNVFSLDEPISSDEVESDEQSAETGQLDSGRATAGEIPSMNAEVPDWFADIGSDTLDEVEDETDNTSWDGDMPQPQEDVASFEQVPDWFTASMEEESVSEPLPASDSAALEADWLLEDDEELAVGESESGAEDFAAMFDKMQIETSDANITDLDEADLTADEEENFSDFAAMFEAVDEPDQLSGPADDDTADTADWAAEEDEDITDFAAMFEAADEPDQLSEPVDDDTADTTDWAAEEDERLSSGFTELLAGVIEAPAVSGAETDEDDTEEDLIPPEWVATTEADGESADEADVWVRDMAESDEAQIAEAESWLTDMDETDESEEVETPRAEVSESETISGTELVSDEADDWLIPIGAEEDFQADEIEQSEALSFAAGDEVETFVTSDDADQAMALDWLQSSQESGDDNLALAADDMMDFARQDDQIIAEETAASEAIETSDQSTDWTTQTGEWLRAMPDLELESVPDEVDDTPSYTISDDEQLMGMAFDDLDVSQSAQDDETDEIQDAFDAPYDPFEGEHADQVPEYESATQTGILQPDESPDWMLALTGQLSADRLEADETDTQQDEGEQESLLSALGFETDTKEEPTPDADTASLAIDNLEDVEPDEMEVDKEPFDLEQLAPPAEEEGAMPDWLAAITGTTQQSEDIDFDPVDLAVSGQPDNQLDWAASMDESSDDTEEAFDQDEVLAALGEIEETLGTSDLDSSPLRAVETEAERNTISDLDDPFAEFDFDGLTAESASEIDIPTSDVLDDMFAEFDFGETNFAEAEDEAQPVSEDDTEDEFEFDFDSVSDTVTTSEAESEPEVAQLNDLAHTKGEAGQAETGITFEFEEEASDTPSTRGFSFDDMTPRWLRKPKDAYEDDETD